MVTPTKARETELCQTGPDVAGMYVGACCMVQSTCIRLRSVLTTVMTDFKIDAEITISEVKASNGDTV